MRFLIAALSIAGLLISAIVAKADKRVAFVVGNGAYKNVATLPNAPIDAKSMAKVLRNVGFDVVEGTNLTRDKMTERLLEFGKKAEGADVALFFYAGHGIAINGTNYLLPVDAERWDIGRPPGPLFVAGAVAEAEPPSQSGRESADVLTINWPDGPIGTIAQQQARKWCVGGVSVPEETG